MWLKIFIIFCILFCALLTSYNRGYIKGYIDGIKQNQEEETPKSECQD